MVFLEEARSELERHCSVLGAELEQYVPRVLLAEGADPQEARQLRGYLDVLSPLERQLIQDKEITTLPGVAVIGDAGSGKSYVVKRSFVESVGCLRESGEKPVPFLLDLGQDLIAHEGIATALDLRYHGLFQRTASEHEPGAVLFLDALDEKLLKEPGKIEFINALALFLRHHRDSLQCVVLACRRSFWNKHWLMALDTPMEVFNTDFLDYRDYTHILPDQDQRQVLFEIASSMGISDLLKSPLVGFDLARSHLRGEPLPPSRREWFEKQVDKLLKGRPKDREHFATRPLRDLRFLSKQLACLATWGEQSSWTSADAIDQLGECAALEGSDVTSTIEVLFRRPLFRRSNDRYSFSHQLFQEYLAAEALTPLPIRKQKQLLAASVPSLRDRVLMPFRGVAVDLAESNPVFRDFLLTADPLVAFFAESQALPKEEEERLLKGVMDNAIATGLAYWRGLAPRGDRPDRVLQKYRPKDAVAFLEPYLQSPEELARLWATACAKKWNGIPQLNAVLIELAHDPSQHIEIRTNSIQAVFATGYRDDIRELYGLLSCGDDRIRGAVLRVYRTMEKPSPRQYMALLRGGAYDDSLFGILQTDAWGYGSELTTSKELTGALQAVNEYYGQLGDLWPWLVEGLIHRATELELDDVPPSLVVRIWQERDRYVTERIHKDLAQLLHSNQALFQRVWFWVLNRPSQDDAYLHGTRVSQELARGCNDNIFALLPSDADVLTVTQRLFIEGVLAIYFHQDANAERLQRFKQLAPDYTERLQIRKPRTEQTKHDKAKTIAKIENFLSLEGLTTEQRTRLILSAVSETLQESNCIGGLHPDHVARSLTEMDTSLSAQILDNFAECIAETDYSRTVGDEPNKICHTDWLLAVPFWVLWKVGLQDHFAEDTLDAFLRCYAFIDHYPGINKASYMPVLDRLRELSPNQWEECISWLLEFPGQGIYTTLHYLGQRKSDFYVEQSRQRLKECEFDSPEFALMLQYWQALEPADFGETLHRCYECMKLREDDEHFEFQRNRLLWLMLCRDEDWAWLELEDLIDKGIVPTEAGPNDFIRDGRIPRNVKRLSTVVAWYKLTVALPSSRDGLVNELPHILLQTIIDIDGEDAIQELECLRKERAYPGAEWLGHSIIEIQDRILTELHEPWLPGLLLAFINREAMGIVRDERDLFEWVCQAVEEETESLERHGEQVGGYWAGDEPQKEPICQNILWPSIKRRLSNLGIIGVEERFVGRNRVDLWITRSGDQGQELQVFIELKIARKGYTSTELIDPLEEQLWKRYLCPSGKRFGVYIVLWFKDADRYAYPTEWATKEDFEQGLQNRCVQVAADHQLVVACYVIDMTAPIRRH